MNEPSSPVSPVRPPSVATTTDGSVDTTPSLPPFSPVPSSSATSNELDELESLHSAIASPAPSVYSLTSSLRQQSFRLEYGRELNSHSEIYRLPADEEEIGRLDRQHLMFKNMFGPWPPPLAEIMAPEPGVTKAVLDLGCGSGAWVSDVARAFPECSAVGVDLVPVLSGSMPANCRTEVDDINLGLEHFYDSFDVVHSRLISTGIKDYPGLIDQMARCLRPGGLLIITEWDFRMYDPDRTLLAPWSTTRPAAEASYLCRWFFALARAARLRGGHIDAAALLYRWVTQHPSFTEEDVVLREVWSPTGPWEPKDDWGGVGKYTKEVGEMVQEDIYVFLRGGRPLLLGSGMSVEEVDELELNAHREIGEPSSRILVTIPHVYARKRGAAL